MSPLDIDAHPLAWREFGSGDTIVFLHGLGGSRLAWEPQLRGLGDSWRCVAWDMPGYGESTPLHPLTFAGIADAIARLLDSIEVEQAHLCGLSFGGQQALHTALAYADRVASLILADTSPAFGLDGTDPDAWKQARLRPLDQGVAPAQMAQGVIRSVAGPDLSERGLAEAVAAFERISSEGLRAACECLPTHDVLSRLGEISAPTLVIAGELDHETPLAYSELLARGIAGAELAVIDGVGHLTPTEAPKRFNALVREFLLRGQGSPSAGSAMLRP